jgi:hypothetical protein
MKLSTLLLCAVSSGALCADNATYLRNLDTRVSALEGDLSAEDRRNPPARPVVDGGLNLFATADILAWNYHVDGVPYCFVTRSFNGVGPLKSYARAPHHKKHAGFRLGLGSNLPHDGWDVYASWTTYHPPKQGGSSSTSDPNFTQNVLTTQTFPSAGTTPTAAPESVATASTRFRVRLDLIDAELGREFYVSPQLALRPFCGLRYSCVQQRFAIAYTGGTTLSSTFQWDVESISNFWGIGPRGGVNGEWKIAHGWSLCGATALSLLYGVFSVRNCQEEKTITGALSRSSAVQLTDRFRSSKNILDCSLGIRWETALDQERYAFSFDLIWEHHLFFGHNQMLRFTDDVYSGAFAANQGDFSTQGATLSLKLDF